MLANRYILVASIALLIFTPECLTGAPQFLGDLKNVTVIQGRDATFTCSVTNLGGHRVAWIKSDTKAILAIHDHVITNDRLQVTHNDKDTWTLLIKDVKQTDKGDYMCQVNSIPMVSQTATLEVVIPPEILDKYSTKDLSISEGMMAKFVCAAHGHPKPQITWRKISKQDFDRDKIRIKDKHAKDIYESVVVGEVLQLPPASRDDMGDYMCIAQNGIPPAISKTFKLIVNFEPQIKVTEHLVGAPLGTHITIKCQIEASPKPITFWRNKSGDMIVPSAKYNITEDFIGDYRMISTLSIKPLEPRDFSDYQCVAKNTIGKSEENIAIYELQKEVDKWTTAQPSIWTYEYFEMSKSPRIATAKSLINMEDHSIQNSQFDLKDPNTVEQHEKTGGFFAGISSTRQTIIISAWTRLFIACSSLILYNNFISQ